MQIAFFHDKELRDLALLGRGIRSPQVLCPDFESR